MSKVKQTIFRLATFGTDVYKNRDNTINNHVNLVEALGCSSSDITIKETVKSLGIANTWAGEGAILLACNFLAREIHVYCAVDASSP